VLGFQQEHGASGGQPLVDEAVVDDGQSDAARAAGAAVAVGQVVREGQRAQERRPGAQQERDESGGAAALVLHDAHVVRAAGRHELPQEPQPRQARVRPHHPAEGDAHEEHQENQVQHQGIGQGIARADF